MKVVNKKIIPKSIITYRDLLKSLQNFTKDQLSQPLYLMNKHCLNNIIKMGKQNLKNNHVRNK